MKYLRGKGLNARAAAPRVTGKPGFEARLLQKALAVPLPFHGNLRKQQASHPTLRNNQPVTAHLNGFRRNVLRRGEDGNFKIQFAQFLACNRRETGILDAGPHGAIRDGEIEGFIRSDEPDASAQMLAAMEADKRAAVLLERGSLRRRLGNF